MFERFSDRARRVVVLAQEEARLLNHNYIGTEHILLGLVHEGEGVAAKTLEALDISLAAIRVKVEEIIGHGGQAPSGHIPFTPRAKKVLEMSLREALQLGHDYIGTEHILLGLIREGEGVGAQVLVKLGADLDRVRQQVIQTLSGYSESFTRRPRPSQTAPRGRGIEPARCGFCDTASPECGPLFTGTSGALICARCVSEASGPFGLQSEVRSGVAARLRVMGGRPEPETAEERAARYVPTGPAPDDEDAARRAIEYAFTDPMELSADGTALVNVEDGAELAPYAAEVRGRVGRFIDERENIVVLVKFLNDHHAVVWTTVQAKGRPAPPRVFLQEGRAVVIEGRWKLSRETITERWRNAGVHCPPRRVNPTD